MRCKLIKLTFWVTLHNIIRWHVKMALMEERNYVFFPSVIIFKLFFIIFISLTVTDREEGDRNSHTLSLLNKARERAREYGVYGK